jgi:hypothetical protein
LLRASLENNESFGEVGCASVYVVPGTTKMPNDEVEAIVIAAGGRWLESLPFAAGANGSAAVSGGKKASSSSRKGKGKSTTVSKKGTAEVNEGTQQLIILASEASLAGASPNDLGGIRTAADSGLGVHSIELLFQGLLRQELDLESHSLEEGRDTNKSDGGSKKRKASGGSSSSSSTSARRTKRGRK